MPRISAKFAELKAQHRGALVTYAMAGYPSAAGSLSVLRGFVRGGADIIEIGFPFSDPLADGPAIQEASTVSLQNGTKTADLLNLVKKLRKETDIPLVLMTYANILYRAGFARFIADIRRAGIDGVIIPDMSIEESKEYVDAAKKAGVDAIFLASPNTPRYRMAEIAKKSTGFLYLVAVYGTTGERREIQDYTIRAIRGAKRLPGGTPVGVGFGVSTPADVKRYVGLGADAVIVGSAFINVIKRSKAGDLEGAICRFTRDLRRGTKIKE